MKGKQGKQSNVNRLGGQQVEQEAMKRKTQLKKWTSN